MSTQHSALSTLNGIGIAGLASMTRRVGAILGIVAIVGLAVALIWRVYLHHRQIPDVEEVPAVVEFVSSGKMARALL